MNNLSQKLSLLTQVHFNFFEEKNECFLFLLILSFNNELIRYLTFHIVFFQNSICKFRMST